MPDDEHMPKCAKQSQRRDFGNPKSARQVRLFRNGRNQVLRIPREVELADDEVIVYRSDDRLVVEAVRRAPSLAEVLPTLADLQEDFPKIPDPPSEPEDIL